MLNHVMVGADDIAASKAFYDATLGALGVAPGVADPKGRVFWRPASGPAFSISKPINGEPASHANGGTVGFVAATAEEVQAWHAAGLAHGGTTCEDAPGPRAGSPVHLGYLRDPAGNKLCVVYRPKA